MSMQIDLSSKEISLYLKRRGSFPKEYGSQMKQGQELYLLQGLQVMVNATDDQEITIMQEFRDGKERILIVEPFNALNVLGHSCPSSVVFEVYSHYGFNIFIGDSNGYKCFDESLQFYQKINTSQIKAADRVPHFFKTVSADYDGQNYTREDYQVNIPKEPPEKQEADVVLCSDCGSRMIVRKGPYGTFYGCSQYPKCKGTSKVKTYQRMTSSDLEESVFNNCFGDPSEFGHNY